MKGWDPVESYFSIQGINDSSVDTMMALGMERSKQKEVNVRLIGGGIKVVIRRLDLGSEGKAGIRNDSQVSCLNN